MNSLQDVVDFVDDGHRRYLLHLSIDCAVFGYHDQQLKVLLIRYHGHENWSGNPSPASTSHGFSVPLFTYAGLRCNIRTKMITNAKGPAFLGPCGPLVPAGSGSRRPALPGALIFARAYCYLIQS